MRMRAKILGVLLGVFGCLAFVHLSGCAQSAQGKLNQVEIVYGSTLGELNELHAAGKISDDVFHATVAPNARAAYAAIRQARLQVKAGNASQLDVLLKSINDALTKMQAAKPAASDAGSLMPMPGGAPVQTAMIDPLTISLVIGAGLRLIAAGQKALKGDDLTPEEEALIRQTSDDETAKMEAQDAKIGQ